MTQPVTVITHATLILFGIAVIASGDEPVLDVDAVRNSSLRALKRIDDYPGVAIKGHVEDAVIEYDFRLETLGAKFWLEGTHAGGMTKEDRLKNAAHGQQQCKILGTNWIFIICHDGKRLGKYDPTQATASIELTSNTGLDSVITTVFPKYWTCMMQQTMSELKFARLLQKDVPNISVEWLDRNTKIRFLHKPTQAPPAYTSRWIEIDTQAGFLVSEYCIEGGTLGERKGKMNWKMLDDGNWYPKNGVETINGKFWSRWEITEANFDVRTFRKNFSMFNESLPFGTKVKRDSITEYVGGAAGQREFELKTTAATNFRLKNRP